MKRKWMMVLFLLVCVSMALFAGGDQEKDGQDEKVTLKLWRMGTQENWVTYTKSFIADFEATHPNIEVEYEYMPPVDLPQKLNTAFVAGIGPDIIGCSIQHTSEYAAKGKFLELDDYVDNWAAKDDVMESMLNTAYFNDNYYALAYHPDPYVFVYRKDLFRKAGLDPEDPPESWEELLEVAPQLTERDGEIVTRAGFLMPIDDFLTFVPFAVMNGASYISDDNMPTFNQPEWVEALEVLTKLVKDERVTIETTNNMEWTTSSFAKGNAAIAQVNSTMVDTFKKSYPELKDDVGFFAIERERKSNWNGAWLFAISADSKHPDEAFEFISEWFSPEAMWNMYEATGNLPVLKSLEERFSAVDPELNSALFSGVEHGLGNPLVPWATLQIAAIRKAMGEAFYGEKTPKQALEDNYELLLNEMKEAGYLD